MRTLHLSQDFPNKFHPYMGIFVKQLLDCISGSKIQVEVVSPKPYTIPLKIFPYWNFSFIPRRKDFGKYIVHCPRYIYPIPKKIFYPITSYSYTFFVKRYIKKNIKRPDLIHAHYPYLEGHLAIKLGKIWKIPVITSLQGTIMKKIIWSSKIIKKNVLNTLDNSECVFCISKDIKDICIKLGVSEEKLEIVPNGVNKKIFHPMDRDFARKTVDIDSDGKIVLYVGSYMPVKGIEYLLKAALTLLEKNKNLVFIFIGRGFEKMSRMHSNIKVIGAIEHEKIPFWLNSADLLVLPSLSEGRPNILLEAMACKTPILTTNVGGIPEIVKNNYNGILIPPKRSDLLAENISMILGDNGLRKKIGENGLRFIKKNDLYWEEIAKKVVKIYRKIGE